MKKLVSFTIIMLCIFTLGAQDVKKEKKTKKTKTPHISFDYTVYDYGIIEKGGDGLCEFTFKNTGKEDLILTNVRSSCGCTVPDWPKEAIPKNKTSAIKVKYNTNKAGIINRTITIESNADNNKVVLQIKGRVNDNAMKEAVPENVQSPIAIPQ